MNPDFSIDDDDALFSYIKGKFKICYILGELCGSNNGSWDCVFIVSGDRAILGMCVYCIRR